MLSPRTVSKEETDGNAEVSWKHLSTLMTVHEFLLHPDNFTLQRQFFEENEQDQQPNLPHCVT